MSDSSGVNEDNVPPQEPTDTRERTRAEIELENTQAFAGFLIMVVVPLLLVCVFWGLNCYFVLVQLFESVDSVECFVRKACSTCPSRQPQCAKLQQAMNTTKKFLAASRW